MSSYDVCVSVTWTPVDESFYREVRAESGAWFFEEERRRGDRPQLFGSALVRASFRRAKPASLPRKGMLFSRHQLFKSQGCALAEPSGP